MTVIRVKHQTKYVVINKTALEDGRLSFKAKGIWAYCMSRPDNWEFHISHLATVSKEKEDAIYSGIKELIECGYCEKTQENKGKGAGKGRGCFGPVDYVVYEEPIQKSFTEPDFTVASQQVPENPALLSKESLPNKEKELSCYPPPVVSDSQKISSVDEKRKEALELAQEAFEMPRSITKPTPDGKSITTDLNDVFLASTRNRRDWTTREIHDAWKIYAAYSGAIRDPLRFIEGTIKNHRNEKKVKYLKKEGKICTSNDQIIQYTNSNEKSSAKDTKAQPSLGALLEAAGMMPKKS